MSSFSDSMRREPGKASATFRRSFQRATDMKKGKPKSCARCGSKRIAKILYGLPAFSKELQESLDEGSVVLGGCNVGEDDPTWACADCGARYPPV